jgi:hypothetical protein
MTGLVIGQPGGGRRGVSSVALTVPSFLSVAGSPITDAGTLEVSLVSQNANLVFAGPASGGGAAPTFRSLVEADIPTLTTQLATTVILAPAASARNVIQPTGATVIPLVVKGTVSQSANLQEWQDTSANIKASISPSGSLYISSGGGIRIGVNYAQTGTINLPNNNAILWRNAANTGDLGIQVTTSDILRIGAYTELLAYANATATAPSNLTLTHNSTATPTTDFGVGIAFNGKSSTTVDRSMGRVRTQWTTATDASRTSKMVLSVYNVSSEIDQLALTTTGAEITGTTANSTAKALTIKNSSNAEYASFRNDGRLSLFGDTLSLFYDVSNQYIYANTSKTLAIYQASNQPITFSTNSLERMQISGSGNVGIGATPLAKFQIKVGTDQNFTVSSSSSMVQLGTMNDAGNAHASIRFVATDYHFWNAGGAQEIVSLSGAGVATHLAIDGGTNATVNTLILDRQSTSTPAAGFGAGVLFQLESDTTVSRSAGRLRYEWVTATDASRASRAILSIYNVGSEVDGLTLTNSGAGWVNLATGSVSASLSTSIAASVLAGRNTAAGVGSAASISLGNDASANSLALVAYSSVHSTKANLAEININATALTFAVGGTERMRLTSTGTLQFEVPNNGTIINAKQGANEPFKVIAGDNTAVQIRRQGNSAHGLTLYGGTTLSGVGANGITSNNVMNFFVTTNVLSMLLENNTGYAGFGTGFVTVTAPPLTQVHVQANDAVTNATTNVLTLEHQSSGTPAANFGVGIQFLGESSSTIQRSMGRIRTQWSTATDASRASSMIFSVYNGAVEVDALVIESSGRVAGGVTATVNSQYAGTFQLNPKTFQNGAALNGALAWTGTDTSATTATGAATSIRGAVLLTNTASVAHAISVKALGQLNGSGATLTNWYGFYAASPIKTGSDTLTNSYGLYMEDQNVAATLNYAIYTNAGRVHLGDDVDIPSNKAFYLGDPTTDGSWRITRSGADLVIQVRVAGVWTTKSTIAA